MLAVMLLAFGLGQEPAVAPPERAPRHRTGLPANRPPDVSLPPREEFAQVTLFCTVRRADRLDDCRVVRQWPETSRLGALATRPANGFRLTRGSAIPGDTFEFDLWICADVTIACRRQPWPETAVSTPGEADGE